MANNPFYPGYSPKKEGDGPVNPMYPGYYTGKPISKRPDSGYIQPVEFDFDIISDQIDAVGKAVSDSPLSGPKWVKDRVIDDWKSQLKVSVSPTSNINVTEMDDFATDDFAGATTALSLNPKDWGAGQEDSNSKIKKQAIKTLNSWLKETTGIDAIDRKYDASEISNKANQELFLMAMGYKDPTFTSRTEKIGAEAVAERTVAPFSALRGTTRPLDIKGIWAQEIQNTGRVVEHRDLYRETALAASEFINSRDSYKNRDTSHTKFLSKAFDAVNIEILSHHMGGNPTYRAHEGAIESFDLGVQTLKLVEGFQDSISGKNGEAQKLQKIVVGKEKASAGTLSTLLTDAQTKITNAKSEIVSLETRAEGLFNSGIISDKSYQKYLQHTKKYKEHFDKLKENIDDYRGSKTSLGSLVKNLRGTTPNNNFTSRTTFQDNLAGGLRRDLETSLVGNDVDDIGTLLNDPSVISTSGNLGAKKVVPIITRLRQDRIKFATKEVLDSFDEGGIKKMAEAYIWKRIKNEMPEKLRWFSSGEVLGDALQKKNYFGLKITESGTPPTSAIRRYARFEKKFGYKVNADLDPTVSSILGLKKITVWGKDAEDSGSGLNILKYTDKYFSFRDRNPAISRADKELFSKLLNNDRSSATLDRLTMKMFNKNLTSMGARDTAELHEFLEKFEHLGTWVDTKTGGRIRVLARPATPAGTPAAVDENDPAFLLFESIYNKNKNLNDGYKLTDRKFIGRLEKINNKMQDLQKAWQKTFIGKTIKFVNNWKEIVSEKIVALLSKALSKLLGIAAATTGVLATLAPILQAILEKAIKKGLDYATTTLKAIMKLDFSDLDKMLQKDVEKIVQGCLIVWVGITAIIILPILLFFGLLTSAISPVDSSRDTESYEGYGGPSYTGRPLPGVFAMDFYNNHYNYIPSTTDPNLEESDYNSKIYKMVSSIGCTLPFDNGVEVKTGDPIAKLADGKTCCSSGLHLHFEINVNCNVVDPKNYLKNTTVIDKYGYYGIDGAFVDLGTGEWDWPQYPVIVLTQEFGEHQTHNGLDLWSKNVGGDADPTVLAPKEGILVLASSQCGSCILNFAAIDHGNGIKSFYLHIQ